MPWVLYILLCDQKTYYIGITSNIENRLRSPRAKENIATKEFSDLKLVYTKEYGSRSKVEKREKQLKGWSIAKKEALISGNLDLLIKLSKTRSLLKVEPSQPPIIKKKVTKNAKISTSEWAINKEIRKSGVNQVGKMSSNPLQLLITNTINSMQRNNFKKINMLCFKNLLPNLGPVVLSKVEALRERVSRATTF